MKTSKFFFSTLIAASAMTATAYAELTTVATMSDLVSVGDLGTGVALNTDYTAESNVYTFGGEGGILNIENSSILDYINGKSGYLTIAAWINPEATSGVQSIFGYGAQSDGFKMATNGSSLAFTTKGVADKDTLGTITAGEWNLVALTINLSGGDGSKYLIGDTDYWTRTLGAWTTPSEANQTFAIGSGNSESNRELFTGSIANLTIAYSEAAATNAEVVALLGEIQINTDGKLVWAGTAESNTWNTTTTNWLNGETTAAFVSDADVAFTDSAPSKTVTLESGVTVSVGDVLVGGSGYVFSAASDGTATLEGKTLKILTGASLSVGAQGNNTSKHVVIDFDSISVSGTLNFNTIGENKWSSVTLEKGGRLHLEDGTPSSSTPVNLTIETLNVAGASDIDFTYDKHLKVNSLAGTGDLTITGGSDSNWGRGAKVTIEALQDYSGTIAVNEGVGDFTLNLGAEGKTTASSANVTVNSGTLNIAGTTTLGTLTLGSTTVNAGTATTVGNLVMGQGSGVQTATIEGALTISENLTQTGIDNGEKLTVKAGGSISLSGYAFTDDSSNTKLSQSVITLEDKASFSANSIIHTDGLTINLGKGATVSTGVMTLNAVWGGAKVHSFVAADGVTDATVNVDELKIGSNKSGADDSTTFNLSNVRLNVGAGGITTFGSGTASKTMVLTNATFGVRDTAESWSSSATMTLNGANMADVADGKSISLSGNLSDGTSAGALTKTGTGTLTLSGDNKYTGGTTISAGTLIAGSNSALGTNSVKISGGKLEVSSDVTVSNNITVVLGDTLDAAAITGDGSLGGKITLDYAASAENVALALATEETTKTYTLLSGNVGSSLSMDFFELGTGWADGWKISGYVYDSETRVGTLTLGIPEPSAFGLLAGVGALALVASRRRRSRR